MSGRESARSVKQGVLLVNLGTPNAPKAPEVRRYLAEFLSDPRVLDIPAVARALLLRLVILPFRPRKSAEAYRKIWTDRGSPLLVHGLDLAVAVRQRVGAEVPVELGMRYGQPSLGDAMARLAAAGVDELIVLPLYPQYASSSTGSTLERVYALLAQEWNVPQVRVVGAFYDHPAFIAAMARHVAKALEALPGAHLLLSYHGLPERQCRKSDPTGRHCLASTECCAAIVEANRHCYRAQCMETSRRLAERLDLTEEAWTVSFQSRLGRTPWIRPYTDEVLPEMARSGCKDVVVACPAFTADCLETLEEIGMRAAEDFSAAGGGRLHLVPGLNAEAHWADAVVQLLREQGLRTGVAVGV
ncbi:MAG: ferrochelatase [Candidatus Sericytochromatia bacterium]|nr:ferrochelatase [Candidatus Sericytochromatia bacterium]